MPRSSEMRSGLSGAVLRPSHCSISCSNHCKAVGRSPRVAGRRVTAEARPGAVRDARSAEQGEWGEHGSAGRAAAPRRPQREVPACGTGHAFVAPPALPGSMRGGEEPHRGRKSVPHTSGQGAVVAVPLGAVPRLPRACAAACPNCARPRRPLPCSAPAGRCSRQRSGCAASSRGAQASVAPRSPPCLHPP